MKAQLPSNLKETDEYYVIRFPESQELQDLDGFDDNAFLVNDERGLEIFGPCAYFVNKKWYNEQI
jgi:hypothetical protein